MTIHTCQICGYSTNRPSNLQAHLSKQKSCKPPPPIQEVQQPLPVQEIVIQELPSPEIGVKVNQCIKCDKILSTPYCLKQHLSNCKGCHILQCPICLKKFASRSSKSQHIKSAKCNPPTETVQEELERLRKENKVFRSQSNNSQQPQTIINNDNSTVNNINIQYNNYDKPYTDHITNIVMKGIYENSQQDPALILNETVRHIYKNDQHPENHVIKITDKAAFSKVYKDGKEICLPMDGVIQTILSNTGDFCADRLRDCHEEGDIEGTRVVVVWKLLEVLGTDDREDDALNRSIYVKSIKSAFL
jgi:hypothetical protein